ncbi:MAG: cytochrome ubiquinol oxidase subunit I [Opitutaceae bacterium]|nr:cytochrome ubiquinol oxidase subunit I [Opitutaceae bacterium]
MELDPLVLSRIQFAANISFHILFPSISIGLCWFLLFFRIRYTVTGDKSWEFAYFSWVKIFALTFALGVVTGITMSFQFGTNWPGFMARTGNISGPLLGYEILTAFFMEASFLGIMLFGKDRVSNRIHLLSTFLVALGTTFSAFWILSLNSWMHTPTGYRLEGGVFFAVSWWDIVFNPSFPYRMAHMTIASLLTASFLIAGLSAWRVIRKTDSSTTWKLLKVGVLTAAVLTPLQIVVGDLHGLNTLKYQPAKIAAIEGVWETEVGVPLTLFGMPNEETRQTEYAVKIPKLGSIILTHELEGKIIGLNEFGDMHPPVAVVFWAFRVMVAVGVLMLIVSWWGSWQMFRRQRPSPWLPRILALMTFSGWCAVLAGWYVTEIGRQPYMVYGILTTSDIVADHPPEVLIGTLIGYLALYAFLLTSYIGALHHLVTRPPRSLKLLHEYSSGGEDQVAIRGAL